MTHERKEFVSRSGTSQRRIAGSLQLLGLFTDQQLAPEY
jgi:hypothetical protein